MNYKKNKRAKNETASKLITKDKLYTFKPGASTITVSTLDSKKKYGYSNTYIKNNSANREKIISLKGHADFCDGRYIWM